MNLTLFYRHPQKGFSIQRCFQALEPGLAAETRLRSVYLPGSGCSATDLIRNLWHAWRHREKNGINHITGDVHYLAWVLPARNTVITIHDLRFIEQTNGIRRRLLYWLFISPLRRCRAVICISQKTKQELLQYLSLPESVLRVVPDPLPEGYQYFPKTFSPAHPVVLHIGTKENKNLERTIKAVRELAVHLRIIGPLTPEQRRLLEQHRIDFSNGFNLSDAEILEEYRKCDLLCFASLFEGFGMPIIEAQSVGRVVLTSNLPPMNQVGGDGAWYVSPLSEQEIRNGLLLLIKDSQLREKLIAAGQSNAAQYSPAKIVASLLRIYRELQFDVIPDSPQGNQ